MIVQYDPDVSLTQIGPYYPGPFNFIKSKFIVFEDPPVINL